MNVWYPLWAHLPLGNHLFRICTSYWYKERAPVLLKKPFSWPVLYLPRTALPCKAIDTMKSIFMNPEHKAWPTPPAQHTACSVFTLLSCIVSGQPPADRGFLKDRAFFFSMQAVRSVHPSNPQESESEYLVKDGGRKVFTVLKNLGLVNAWENIASSALNFLIWLEASQTSHKTHLKLWAHARRGTASLFVSFSLGKIWPMVFCAAYTEWQAPTLLWCSH